MPSSINRFKAAAQARFKSFLASEREYSFGIAWVLSKTDGGMMDGDYSSARADWFVSEDSASFGRVESWLSATQSAGIEASFAKDEATGFTALPATVFINEIHYDNTGTDVGEAIEIAGPAGTDLAGYSLVLYNGSTTPGAAVVYNTINLTGSIDNEGSGFGAVSFSLPANGLQNGAFDGIALIGPGGVVLQFLSYEGVITGAAGTPAAGVTSTDIGVLETGTEAVGLSLQLTGTGTTGTNFAWQAPATASFGTINAGQTFTSGNTAGALAINSASIAEGNSGTTNLTFTVLRSGGSTGAVSATWTASFGAGAGNADASDFDVGQLFTGTVSFADGQISQTITLVIAGDTVSEPNEAFTMTLSAPTGGATIATASGTGTITNDDAAPGTLSIANSSVIEGNSGTTPISFTVTRAGGSDGAVSATWTASFGAGVTAANSADFAAGQLFTGTVNFANGETSQVITLNVQGDTATEQTETFAVTLSAPTGGAALGTSAATGTITTDDTLPANVFINEIHYDNSGVDANEAVEIAGRAGTDLTGYSLVLYNGSNTPGAAVVYTTINLTGVIDDEGSGYGALSFAAAGIQNGAADGIALIAPGGTVVQFLSYEGTITAAAGTPAAGLTSTDIGVSEDGTGTSAQSLQLIGNGAAGTDFTWQAPATSSFGSLNVGQTIIPDNATGLISVGDASVVEGNSGTSNLVFVVERAGGLGTAASVDYTVNLTGTANAADIGAGAVLSGTVNFAIGAATATITIPVQGDALSEGNETLSLTLSNAVGNVSITDANANGTITNDDPVTLTIMEIQGAGHQSAYVGQPITTTGIVTAVDTNGYYLQDPTGDANVATSDGIFVFTSTAPTVAVGDSVSVSGSVSEFRGSATALTLTQITSPVSTVLSSGNPLPAAVLIGTGGRTPPTAVYDDDGYTVFDPANDAIDFYETLEGMRVTIDAPQVVGDTNSFGETWVVASGGAGATTLSARGGITISAGDMNPERIQIDDDSGVFAGYVPGHTIGDRLGNVTGVFNYAFDSYELVVTEAVTVTLDNTLTRESTLLRGDDTHITIATYNLENIDPTDPSTKFDLLASDIVLRLGAPDIIAVQEIQDADGAGSGSNLSGTVTAQLLINAIIAAGGPTYAYVEVAPSTANSTGGEPNGNIRNGYFYNTSRVSYVAGSATLISDVAFTGSRSPLVATFEFNGQSINLVNMHSTSRGGSDPLFGEQQPPTDAGDASRTAQATAVRAYINAQLATNPNLNFAVMGDFNGFTWENAISALTAGNVLSDLNTLLPLEERYSYFFDGNLQALDHILVTNGLAIGARYDAVHINAEFTTAARGTDHDPQVAALFLAPVYNGDGQPNNFTVTSGANWIVYGNDGDDVLNGGVGNDVIFGGEGADQLDGGAANDVLVGGADNDVLAGGVGTNEMIGGTGDDTYVYTGPGSIVEFQNEGTDLIRTSLSLVTLPSNVENLTYEGTGQFIGVGNDLDNVIVGSTALDTLIGFGGNDMLMGGGVAANEMIGGTGDDSYFVSAIGDTLIEAAGEGNDTVYTDLASHVLRANIEGLVYTGNSNFTGIGNDLGNQLSGGAGDDFLSGLDGDDSFLGGSGADLMIGGAGADTFRYQGGEAGLDRILGFTSGEDRIALLSSAFARTATVDFISGVGATANSSNSTFLYDSSTGILSYDADGDGAGAAVQLAQLDPGLVLNPGDFLFY